MIGTATRMLFIWTGWCDQYIIADDAYYYYTIARNVASGLGPTFDGVSLTNGFHPLFLILILPIFSILGIPKVDIWLPVHATLSLCAFFDLLSGLFLYKILRKLDLVNGAVWAAGLWFLSPFTILITLRGLEGSLSVLVFAFWLSCTTPSVRVPSVRECAFLGFIYGIAVLARTDMIVFLGAMAAAQFIMVCRFAPPPIRGVVASLGAFLIVLVLTVSPWASWNLTHFGSLIQVSGLVKIENPRVFGSLVRGSDGIDFIQYVKQCGAILLVPLRYVAGEELGRMLTTFPLFALVGGSLVMSALHYVRQWKSRMSPPQRTLVIGLVVMLMTHWIVYSFVLKSYVVWYATIPSFILSCLLGISAAEELNRLGPQRARLFNIVVVGASICVFLHFFSVVGHEPRAGQTALVPVFDLIKEHAPETRSIGAYNAGAIGYFAPAFGPYRVVNLDGLVNNEAYAAWRKGIYYQYLISSVDLLWIGSLQEFDIWLSAEEKSRILHTKASWSDGQLYGPFKRLKRSTLPIE